ncbi:MAG: tetratricopeptide repeat protein [Chloroflexota bacterium]
MKEHLTLGKLFTWTNFVRLICGILAVVFLAAVVVKIVKPELLTGLKIETILAALAIAILFPYISQLEAFGVKVEIRKQVEDLSSQIKALPDYMLGSEYHTEDDYEMAEQSYRKSLEQCPTFWPAILGLAGVYHDEENFAKAIREYKRVLELDKNNVYALNNLADVYTISDPPLKSPEKALEAANLALQIVPSKGSTLHYKAVALNELGRYREARDILNAIISQDMLEDQCHWVMYELAIANSRLGTKISLDYLGKMLLHAKELGAAGDVVEALARPEELERFDPSDRSTIQKFLRQNKTYLQKDTL